MNVNELTHRIIGCAMQVQSVLGNGFQELTYKKALEIEFKFQQIQFEQEKETVLYYREVPIGTRRVDFLIEGLVLVEIKAIEKLLDNHKAQAINCLEAYQIPDGLIINFGTPTLEIKRIYNKKLVKFS